MSTTAEEPTHGHSPAAWTAVVIMLIGFAAGTVGFCFEFAPVVIGASILIPIGLIVGLIMKGMGYGVGGSKSEPKGH